MPKRSAASPIRWSAVGAVDFEQRRRVAEVVPAGQAVVERGTRGHHAAAAACLGALVGEVRVEAERAHRARVGMQRAGDEAHHGGLARAVRPEQHGDGAAGHDEGEVVDRDHVAERAPDA